MVKDKLISDIELRLFGGRVSDDAPVVRAQISHWLDVTRDRLVGDEIEAAVRKGEGINPDYIYSDEDLQIQSVQLDSEVDPRYYAELTRNPLHTRNDTGIKVLTTDGEPIDRESLWERDFNKHLSFGKATINHLVYNRRGTRLYIEGVTRKTASDYGVHAYYIISYGDNPPAENEDFVISDKLAGVLLDLVEETARKEFQIKPDQENDGN